MPRPLVILSEADKDEIRSRWQAGERVSVLVKEFGTSKNMIERLTRGMTREKLPPHNRMPDAAIQRAQEMRDAGISTVRIGYELGFRSTTILARTTGKKKLVLDGAEQIQLTLSEGMRRRLNTASRIEPYHNRCVIIRDAIDVYLRQMGL